MTLGDEQLALEFARHPVRVYGVYRTLLEAERYYDGHKEKRTEKCALLLVLNGRAEFRFTDIQGQLCRLSLQPGNSFIGGLNMNLEIQVGEEDFEYVLIHYMPVSLMEGEGYPAHTHMIQEINMDQNDSEVSLQAELMLALLEVAAKPGHMEQLEKQTLFYRLLESVLRASRNTRNRESGRIMNAAQEFIHRQYMEPLTLEGLAARFGMRSKYFSHRFQQYSGMGPMRYLSKYRLNRARELLEVGNYSVKEVAAKVGYADPYYFSRVFKLHMGLAPSEIKKKGREGKNPS
ncbi:AraC family transcriptional regulator [Paenibacillus hubeiensis]|uniref:AraC family transcriptional regulator n=1 Tax=Paenibacillus hubeiensis TaxID=3077330 RepID=UPI0031BBA8AB